MTTVSRGSSKIQIVRKTLHNIPSVIIGHLDRRGNNPPLILKITTKYLGREILDSMLKENKNVIEVIEFFKKGTCRINLVDLFRALTPFPSNERN